MTDLIKKEPLRVDHNEDPIKLGDWYWVGNKDSDPWFGCITEIGSNYVQVSAPRHKKHGYSYARIHNRDIFEELRKEENPTEYIQTQIGICVDRVRLTLDTIQQLTRRLGVSDRLQISEDADSSPTRELALVSSQIDINQYKNQLIKAKEKDLPDLFKLMEEHNENLCMWMTAETLPMLAMSGSMKSSIKHIEDRIFNISLYAGLTEEVEKIQDGSPADISEKLHVMQTVLFMDEECLLNYQTGGMEFNDLHQFDTWLCQPINLRRILPFNRTMVAMRVRRHKKSRDTFSISDAFVNIQLEAADKLTFMYIRNGDQVYRMSCDLDFGEQLFPGREVYQQNEPLYFNKFATKVENIIGESEYLGRLEKERERKIKKAEWAAANPTQHHFHNPFDSSSFNNDWIRFDQDTVYYDDCKKVIDERIQQYNRIALIIQGLFDRSPVLHPHPPVKTWTEEGANSAIKLIYDKDNVIAYGEAPDFLAYKNYCNSLTHKDSIMMGQEEVWEMAEAKKENERNGARHRYGSYTHYDRYAPYGNPGPGKIAHMAKWKPKSQVATFTWMRCKVNSFRCDEDEADIPCKILVELKDLFNISAYKAGDFRIFFEDPRTRKRYIEWANLLLTAEEYLAGNLKVKWPF